MLVTLSLHRDALWLKTPEDFFLRLEVEGGQSYCRKMVSMGGRSCNRSVREADL